MQLWRFARICLAEHAGRSLTARELCSKGLTQKRDTASRRRSIATKGRPTCTPISLQLFNHGILTRKSKATSDRGPVTGHNGPRRKGANELNIPGLSAKSLHIKLQTKKHGRAYTAKLLCTQQSSILDLFDGKQNGLAHQNPSSDILHASCRVKLCCPICSCGLQSAPMQPDLLNLTTQRCTLHVGAMHHKWSIF
jgi:hypothetical protein